MPGYNFHQKCYTCSHVVKENRPILFAYKDADDFILHCGEGHDWELDPPKVVGIGHLIEKDASVEKVLSLNNGFEMERASLQVNWEIRLTPPTEE
jgi:hypothetical protein